MKCEYWGENEATMNFDDTGKCEFYVCEECYEKLIHESCVERE